VLVAAGLLMPTVALAGSAEAATTRLVSNHTGGDAATGCATPDYTTIAAAVAAASSGDTIKVCSGTYPEQTGDGGKDLQFLGAQQDQDARTRDTSSAATTETTVVAGNGQSAFVLSGSSAINGFTVTGYTPSPFTGGAVQLVGPSERAVDTIFTGNSVASVVDADGAYFGQDKVVGTSATDDGGFYFGLFANSAGDNATVETTDFSGGLFSGITSGPGRAVDHLTVRNNTSDTSGGGMFARLQGSTSADVNNNLVTGGSASSDGIGLFGNNTGFSVTQNRISGLTGANAISLANPSGLPDDNGDGTINQNSLKHNRRGIDDGSDTGTVEAHSNIFVANTSVAFRNTTNTSTFDGQDNFYGCNGGPGAAGCDVIAGSGAIHAAPFLVLSSTIGTHTLAVGQHTTFTANLNKNNAGSTVATPLLSGEPITFGFTKGTTTPPNAALGANGAASTTVAATASGPGTVTGTVENATTSQKVNGAGSTGPPQLTIHDAGTAEGNSGTHPLNFSVSLSRASSVPVSVKYTTANGSARAPSDFIAKSGTLTIAVGHTSATIAVLIKGDTIKEPNETLAVNLFSPTNAAIADPVGQGVIRNDD
jgi:hypothetical protein